jgi:hypothetical protein
VWEQVLVPSTNLYILFFGCVFEGGGAEGRGRGRGRGGGGGGGGIRVWWEWEGACEKANLWELCEGGEMSFFLQDLVHIC